MKLLSKVVFVLFSFFSVSLVAALPNDTFTASQKEQIEAIIHSYLIKNPSVLMEASKALYEQKMQIQTKKMKSAVRAHADNVLHSPSALILGNPQGSITIAEFFDYQCSHCQQMQSSLNALIKANPQLRIVLHNVPLLGSNSLLAAQMVLAAQQQHKALPLHEALMSTNPPLDENKILAIAKTVGLDSQRLQSDIKKKFVTDALKQEYQLVKQMELDFTPAFVIAKTDMRNHSSEPFFILQGEASEKEIQSKIDQLKY